MTFLKKNPFLIFGIALLILGGAFLFASHQGEKEVSDTPQIVSDTATTTGETPMTFEIADTPGEHTQGLSGRRSIPDNYGLLFVFDAPSSPGFWMKDMHISIDIIWLSDTGEILGIEHSVSPDTYPDVFNPPAPVSYVLETRAGLSKEKGWDTGDTIDLPNL